MKFGSLGIHCEKHPRQYPNAPLTGEPTHDDSILYFESCARAFVSDKERKRVLGGRTTL